MIVLNRRTKVFLSKEPADMRASYDTLFHRAKEALKEDKPLKLSSKIDLK